MKKLVLFSFFAFAVLFANAQLKIYPTTKNVAIGGTAFTPNSVLTVGSGSSALGNSLFQSYFYNSQTATGATAIRGDVAVPASAGNNAYGIVGYVQSGYANTFGVVGYSYNSTAQTAGQSWGVYGYAGNAQSGQNYGVWGRLLGSNNGTGVLGTDYSNS